MTKFSGPRPTIVRAPTVIPTHEGGVGYQRTPRQELFLQAVSEMAEDTYYETAEVRQTRLAENVAAVLAQPGGWGWVSKLVPWLRSSGNMRSASIMVAAEAVAANNGNQQTKGLTPRQLIASACLRADEPAEMLAYWLEFHGRQIPAAVKRGVADAAVRLYTEQNVLKYDGQSRSVRMADVVELTHPRPSTPAQSDLFKFVIDRRHGRANSIDALPVLSLDLQLQALPESERLAAFEAGLTDKARWSWERVAGWLPGGLSSQVWESIIPTMGYMALLRNLRNFDQAGVSDIVKKQVIERLSDPEQVASSRQFPYRFLSAWKATESMEWGPALESALNHSINNVPVFEGRTLILVDTSGSMQSPLGGVRSHAQRWEVAGLFGAVLAARNSASNVDLAIYATDVSPIRVPTGSALRFVEQMQHLIGSVGHGTNTWGAIQSEYRNHDRVVVLTDEQSHDFGTNPGCFMHFINLAGYRPATAPQNKNTFAYGGFTDAMFSLLPTMERGSAERWPWD